MNELIDNWSEYEPEGTGFMTPEFLAFLLHEMAVPLGVKDDNEKSLKSNTEKISK